MTQQSESEHYGGADDESPTTDAADADVDLEDEDLESGETHERREVRAALNGNTVGDSQSEADMALCCLSWRSGSAATGRRWITRSASQDCFGRSGTRSTTLTGRRTGEDHRASDCDHVGVLRPGRRRRYRGRHPGGSSPDVGAADSERSRAYLAEKNRLLSERVDELEATLTEKTERIDASEAGDRATH